MPGQGVWLASLGAAVWSSIVALRAGREPGFAWAALALAALAMAIVVMPAFT